MTVTDRDYSPAPFLPNTLKLIDVSKTFQFVPSLAFCHLSCSNCLQLRSLPSSASASCCTLLPEAPLAPPVAPQGSLCNSCRFAETNRSGPDIFDNIPVELTSPVYVESRAFSFHTNRRSLSVEENPLTRKGGGGEDIRRGLKMISLQLVSHLDSLSRHAVTPEAIFFV